MSKKTLSVPLFLVALLQILQFVNNSNAQQEVVIRLSKAVAEVKGGYFSKPLNPRNLSFLDNYAGASALSTRLFDMTLEDSQGQSVPFKRFVPGEYVAEADIGSWIYKVDLKPPPTASAAAHISWMNDDIAILMMRDLLPRSFGGPTRGYMNVFWHQGGAKIFSPLPVAEDQLTASDVDRAVVVAGRNLRSKGERVNGEYLSTVLSGEWQFPDDDAFNLAVEILKKYSEIFDRSPSGPFQITIAKFPMKVPVDQWEADTRGTSILILSSDTPFRSQSVQRLHEQLRHEIFHLWIPEGVNLTGSYDWFYEGFALYQSLKLGLAVNRIRFDDYLDTLSRAYDIDKHSSPKISLIQASKDRWSGANTQVYARGMLVAFLCDLALLDSSKGKTSATDLLHDLYMAHRPPAAAADGNEAVLALLRSRQELRPLVDRYITGSDPVDWAGSISRVGLVVDAANKLSVSPKLSGKQRDLLDKMGYNNWRKLPTTRK